MDEKKSKNCVQFACATIKTERKYCRVLIKKKKRRAKCIDVPLVAMRFLLSMATFRQSCVGQENFRTVHCAHREREREKRCRLCIFTRCNRNQIFTYCNSSRRYQRSFSFSFSFSFILWTKFSLLCVASVEYIGHSWQFIEIFLNMLSMLRSLRSFRSDVHKIRFIKFQCYLFLFRIHF